MRTPWLAGPLVLGVLVLTDCQCSIQIPCHGGNCPGCCGADGLCRSGNVDSACGEKGAACADCTLLGRACLAAACRARSGGDGGEADGGALADGGCLNRCSGPKLECTAAPGGFRTCVAFGALCWDWVEGTCPAGTACSAGLCLNADGGAAADGGGLPDGGAGPDGGCPDECLAGQKRCVGAASVQVCQYEAGPGCYRWAPAMACPWPQACQDPYGCLVPPPADGGSDGGCGVPYPCSVSGARQCVGTAAWQECQGTAGCLGWGPAVACSTGQACSQGVCLPTCAATCASAYASRCPTTAGTLDICLPTDGGCLQWKTYSCGSGFVCSSGKCWSSAVVPVGQGCTTDTDCGAVGTASPVWCITQFPGGFCTQDCDDSPVYQASYLPCPRGRCEYLGNDSRGNPVTLCMTGCGAPGVGRDTCRPDYVCETSGYPDGGTCWPDCRWPGFDGGWCGTATCTSQGYCQ